jgi:DNA-binding transcriptional regulator YdaS (Cro superfamily)
LTFQKLHFNIWTNNKLAVVKNMAKKLRTKNELLNILIYNCGSQKKLAEKIGVCQQSVSKWIVGKANISAKNALKIEKMSNRQIKRWELCPHVFEPPQK